MAKPKSSADGRRGLVILANTAVDVVAPAYKAIVLGIAALDEYVGTYRLSDKLLNVFRVDDGLFAPATGQNAIPIFPSAPTSFSPRLLESA